MPFNNNFTLKDLERYGIKAEGAKALMAYDSVNGVIQTNYDRTANMAMDAAITATNNGFPSVYGTFIDPKVVQVLFAKMAATELATETKVGTWTDEFYNFPLEEIAGNVTGYSDYANGVSSDVNYEYPVREQYRFQTAIKYGELETDKAAVAKIALASRKQNAAAEIIARFENKAYLYGIKGKRIYGLLNDPNLNSTISPVSVGGKSTWADKQAASPDDFANVVFNDVAKLMNELFAGNGGNIDANSEMVLGISNAKAAYLQAPNNFGLTAAAMLKQNYPNLCIVQIPELSTASGDELYLIVPSLMGDATASVAYAEKFRLSRLIAHETSFSQKAIGTTWGAIIRRPALIVTMTGI